VSPHFPVATFAYAADEAMSSLSELANIDLDRYSQDVQITRDRIVRRIESALNTSSAWGYKPGQDEAVAAYIELTRAMELTEVLWYSLRVSTREHRAALDLSRNITKMRLILVETAPVAADLDETVRQVSLAAVC
jgi:hypothetical protein